MADVLRIVDRFMLTGIGPIYMVKTSQGTEIHLGDIFCDLRGSKFVVKGIEMIRRMILADVDWKELPVGIQFETLDGVPVYGNIMVRELSDINFLFCNHPLYAKKIDEDYEAEYDEVVKNHKCALFSYEDLEKGKLSLNGSEITGLTIYRGWMMKPAMYKNFYELLEERGIMLINSPEEYVNCHTLPGWYNSFSDVTAESIWISGDSVAEIMGKASVLEGAYIVKDYVKSRKHEWYDACYIPNIKDKEHSERVITNFVNRQGDSLAGGVVLRKYEKLKNIGYHEKSGMPISEEYRAFIFAGKVFILDNYWKGNSDTSLSKEELNWLEELAIQIRSNFATIDLARREDGSLIVMELGDGQVSGLQEIPVKDFYSNLIL